MKDMKENLFLKDIKESGLKPEEHGNMESRFQDMKERSERDIVNIFGVQAGLISNPYTKGLRDSIPAGVFIKEDIRPISGNFYNESTKTTIEGINCECKVDPIG